MLQRKQPRVYSTRKEAITLVAEQMAKDPILSKVSDMQCVASCMHANVCGTCASLDVDSFPLSHIAACGKLIQLVYRIYLHASHLLVPPRIVYVRRAMLTVRTLTSIKVAWKYILSKHEGVHVHVQEVVRKFVFCYCKK